MQLRPDKYNGLSDNNLIRSQSNLTKTWKLLFMKPYIPNRSCAINWEQLNDPNNPLVILIIYIFTMETFVYFEINKGLRNKDTCKAATLGPFAKILGYIMAFDANRKRKDGSCPLTFTHKLSRKPRFCV